MWCHHFASGDGVGNCFCSRVCKSPTASCTESEDRFTKFHTNLFSKLPGAALNTRIYCELQKAVSQFFNVPTCQFVACRLFLTIDKNPHFSGEMLWRHLYCRVLVCPQLSHLSHIQWTLFYVYFVLTDLTRMVKFFHRKRSCTGWVCLSVCLSVLWSVFKVTSEPLTASHQGSQACILKTITRGSTLC